MSFSRFPIGAAVAAAVLMATSPMALAQAANPQEAPSAAPQVTNEQLETYAVAALEVHKINQNYQPLISQAGSPEEQKDLYDKATQEMTEAIRNNGLSVEQYNQITTAVQSNPELSDQVQGFIDQNQNQ